MTTKGLVYVIDQAVCRQIPDALAAKYCECMCILTELDLQFNERTARKSAQAFSLFANVFEEFIINHTDVYTKNEEFSRMLCLLGYELGKQEQYLEYRLLKLSKLN